MIIGTQASIKPYFIGTKKRNLEGNIGFQWADIKGIKPACTDSAYLEYDSTAQCDDGSCLTPVQSSLNLIYETIAIDAIPGMNTYRVYVQLDPNDPNAQLNAVFGNSNAPMSINTTTNFYQHPYGGPTSQDINSAFISIFPDLEFDSWLTIEREDNTNNHLMDIGILNLSKKDKSSVCFGDNV